MEIKEIIKKELNLGKRMMEFATRNLSEEQGKELAPTIGANVNWNIGHSILATLYYGVMCIDGPNLEHIAFFDRKKYAELYGIDTQPEHSIDGPELSELLNVYDQLLEVVLANVDACEDLSENIEIEIPNPVVKTKYDAFMWISSHQFWHNGQMATISRIITQKAVFSH